MTKPMPTLQPPRPTRRASLRDVPVAFWGGLALFGLGFVVKAYAYSRTSGSLGSLESSCSYTDVAALFCAAGMIVCVFVGWATNSGRARTWKPKVSASVMLLFSVALLALSAVHVLRGIGTVGGPCQ